MAAPAGSRGVFVDRNASASVSGTRRVDVAVPILTRLLLLSPTKKKKKNEKSWRQTAAHGRCRDARSFRGRAAKGTPSRGSGRHLAAYAEGFIPSLSLIAKGRKEWNAQRVEDVIAMDMIAAVSSSPLETNFFAKKNSVRRNQKSRTYIAGTFNEPANRNRFIIG